MSTTNDNNGSNLDALSIEAIEAELKQFEIEERKRLGLDQPELEPETAVFPSPFDYASQALLYVPTDLPAPKPLVKDNEWQGVRDGFGQPDLVIKSSEYTMAAHQMPLRRRIPPGASAARVRRFSPSR
jgi:hypothetical protein